MRTTLFRRAMAGAILISSVVGANFWAAGTTQAETDIENIQIMRPITMTVLNSCAQEYVTVTGEYHLTGHTTINDGGITNVQLHSNFANVSGTGDRSGSLYRVIQGSHTVNHINEEISAWPLRAMHQSSYRFIGAGDTANFMYWFTTQLTFDEHGQVTVEFAHGHFECHGDPLPPYPAP